jgi:hypothetical protein
MIDWAARAACVLGETPQVATDKTDETRVSSVSSVRGGGGFTKNEVSPACVQANQWEIRGPDGRVRVVAYAPAWTLEEVRRRYPDAVALIETASTVSACVRCIHASMFGNCGIPERAGLSEQFMIVKHSAGGTGCPVFAGAS